VRNVEEVSAANVSNVRASIHCEKVDSSRDSVSFNNCFMKGVIRSALCLIFVCHGHAASDIAWKTLSPSPDLWAITSLAFGDGRFVAATQDGLAFSQDNGLTWTESATAAAGKYNAVLHANGLFVAVGNAGSIRTSPDGITWTSQGLSLSNDLHTITHGNDIYVATGTGGIIATSPNALNWTVLPSQTTNNLLWATFGNGRFLVLEPNAVGLISTNGTNWSRQFHNITQADPNCALAKTCVAWSEPLGLTFGDNQFVMKFIGDTIFGLPTPGLLASSDGLNWRQVAHPSSPPFSFRAHTLYHVGGLFVEVGDLRFSTNLVDWTAFKIPGEADAPYAVDSQAIAFGNGAFVIGGSSQNFVGVYGDTANVAVGSDLRQLSPVNRGVLGTVTSLASDRDIIVALTRPNFFSGEPGMVVSTNGGLTFESVQLPSGVTSLNSVTRLGDYFLAVGPEGTILRSTNGVTWSRRLSNTSSELTDIAFGNGLFVAIGANGRIVTSPDSSSFTLRSSGTEIFLNSIAFDDGAFVAIGRAGLILTSANGIDWVSHGTEEAEDLLSVASGNGRFVATGTNGIVHLSTNSLDWTTTFIPGAKSLSRVAYASGRFIAIDSESIYARGAYISTNGLSWSPLALPRPAIIVESYDEKFWFGGNFLIALENDLQPPGLRLTPSLNTSGQLTLSFTPAETGTFSIQATENLTGSSSWTPVATFTNAANPIVWTDTNTTSRARFYRLVQAD
jgi:hypothetical protein